LDVLNNLMKRHMLTAESEYATFTQLFDCNFKHNFISVACETIAVTLKPTTAENTLYFSPNKSSILCYVL
jgi:hypothetical protein